MWVQAPPGPQGLSFVDKPYMVEFDFHTAVMQDVVGFHISKS